MNDITDKLTAIIREADELHMNAGGSTRHYVRDCLLPLLEENNIIILDGNIPLKDIITRLHDNTTNNN